MLKPKYVHGLNGDEAPNSVLNRLKGTGNPACSFSASDADDNSDDAAVPQGVPWMWTLG